MTTKSLSNGVGSVKHFTEYLGGGGGGRGEGGSLKSLYIGKHILL